MRRSVYALTLLLGCAHAGRDSLLQADADWDRAVAERGTEAWVAGFADDGAMYPAGAALVRGHDRIAAAMADLGDPRKAPPALKLRWKPLGAEASADGTLGWTWGNGVATSAAGERRVKYVTVWRRVGDAWKVVADIGTSGEAQPGAGP